MATIVVVTSGTDVPLIADRKSLGLEAKETYYRNKETYYINKENYC
jgi:hypothetical protein